LSELERYDYELPKHLVAQRPLAQRSDARLLVVDRASGSMAHHHVRDLPELLRPADCLVINDSRVLPARLIGRRTGRACFSRSTLMGIGGCWVRRAAKFRRAKRSR
jgi:S-adenosylmethionine:tRNA ribosyltransferase-isomerase